MRARGITSSLGSVACRRTSVGVRECTRELCAGPAA
jgi:hypothetical protein